MSQQKNNPKLRRVAIVEDDSGLRDQLQKILKSAPGVCCVGTFGSAEKALEGMIAAQPDVILMDINLPGISGIECVSRLRNDLLATHFIMLTVYEDSDRLFKSLVAGASGYLLKRTPSTKLLAAIREAHEGGAPMTPQIARRVVQHFMRAEPSSEMEKWPPRGRDILDQ